MSVDAPQPSESPSPKSSALQVREHYRMGAANHNVFDVPLAINQHADLTVYLTRDLSQLTGELLSDYFAWRNSPLV